MSTITDTAKPAGVAHAAAAAFAASAPGSHHDVAAAAAALVPTLRARAAEADALSRLPDATIADLEKARLFDMLRPKMYGGLQVPYDAYLDAIIEVARADGAAAWTLGILSTGIWIASVSYPKHVTDEVFGQDANVRVGTAALPRRTKLRRVAGGYVIEDGMWMYNSGIHHAQWDLLGIPLVDEAGKVTGRGTALVRTSELTLLDDWDSIGLRGSGSTSVAVKDLFVPDERIALGSRNLQDDYAATHLRDVPLYRLPMMPSMAVRLASSMIGMAKAALELLLEKIGTRGIAFTSYDKQDEATITHLEIGEASAKIDAAEAVLRQAIRLMETGAQRGERMSTQQRARIWRDASFASRLIWEGVDQIAGASGTAFINRDAPMNKLWRDVRVAYMHGALYFNAFAEVYGRVAAGKTPSTFHLPELK